MTSTFTSAAAGSSELLVRESDDKVRPATANEVLQQAKRVLSHRLRRGMLMNSPQVAKDFLRLHLGPLEHEVFYIVFLDTQNRLLDLKEMFRGSLAQTTVYPREVVKEALALNAGAVILAHNHPSGSAEPSRADEQLTQTLKNTLAMVDVRVLDHFVVTGDEIVSFAERGLL